MADIRDRVMGDKPNDFLHKIAGIVPGFNGYMDRERRRDADKLLRTYLAHQYSTQRDRLNRAEQSLLRAGQITGISEVDRLVGVLQRFIDRLNTATYGYSGMFDPVKVEAQDLDQLYAFDMALTSGVDEVSSAIGGIETATTSETARTDIPAALSNLGSVLDELNLRLNQRSDLLTTGQGLPADQYNSLVSSIGSTGGTGMPAGAPPNMAPPPPPPPPAPPASTASASTGAPPQYAAGTPSGGAPTVDTSGDMARYPGGYSGYSGGTDQGSNTSPGSVPPYPAGSYTGGSATDTGTSSGMGTDTTNLGGSTPNYGVNTASSPSPDPTSQSSDIAGDLSSGGDLPSSGALDSNTDATNLPDTAADKPQS